MVTKAKKRKRDREAARTKRALKEKRRQNGMKRKKSETPWPDRHIAWRKCEDRRNREKYAAAAKELGISIDSYLERFVNSRYKRPEPWGGRGLS